MKLSQIDYLQVLLFGKKKSFCMISKYSFEK